MLIIKVATALGSLNCFLPLRILQIAEQMYDASTSAVSRVAYLRVSQAYQHLSAANPTGRFHFLRIPPRTTLAELPAAAYQRSADESASSRQVTSAKYCSGC